jgi:ABC-type multidrug transport system ATPase subunit
MKINLSNAGKRFNREWIFRSLTKEFIAGNAYAIVGPNGSGKSTLLQVIAGILHVNEGTVHYSNGEPVPGDKSYTHISYSAPYLDVIEEMTLIEFLSFHIQFKPLLPNVSIDQIISEIGLEAAANKQIRYYSSGMKQRVRLAQAIFSNTQVLLLDEPCSNLDMRGIELYHQLIKDYGKNRLIVVSSNDESEYSFCNDVLPIMNYKRKPATTG